MAISISKPDNLQHYRDTIHRTKRSKGCLNRDGMLHMMFKLSQCAQGSWRKLRGFADLGKVIAGINFKDGIEQPEPDQKAA